jgi:hypothetical protein
MSRNRIGVGVAGLLLGIVLTTGVAGAQQVGTNQSGGGGGSTTTTTVGTTTTSTLVLEDVKGEELTAETTTGGAVEATQAAPSGSLPFTGGDVAGLVIVGGAALGVGVLMVRRSRTADNN